MRVDDNLPIYFPFLHTNGFYDIKNRFFSSDLKFVLSTLVVDGAVQQKNAFKQKNTFNYVRSYKMNMKTSCVVAVLDI